MITAFERAFSQDYVLGILDKPEDDFVLEDDKDYREARSLSREKAMALADNFSTCMRLRIRHFFVLYRRQFYVFIQLILLFHLAPRCLC